MVGCFGRIRGLFVDGENEMSVILSNNVKIKSDRCLISFLTLRSK